MDNIKPTMKKELYAEIKEGAKHCFYSFFFIFEVCINFCFVAFFFYFRILFFFFLFFLCDLVHNVETIHDLCY